MRIRLLHPEFFSDEKLWKLSDFAKLVFEGLWLIADRDGFLVDNVKMIDGLILPCDPRSCKKALEELERAERIRRFAGTAGPVIQVIRFPKWQHPHPNEKASQLREPLNGSIGERVTESVTDQATDSVGESLASKTRANPSDLNINSNSDPVTTDAPTARSDRNGSRSRASGHHKQRRRVAADARPAGGASAPVPRAHVVPDDAVVKKFFG